MTVPVVHWNANPNAVAEPYWAQALYEDLLWRTPRASAVHYDPSGEWLDRGAVVFVPADWNTVADLNAYIADLEWVLLILTGDEAGTFPWWEIAHPDRKIWAQGTRPQIQRGVDRPLPLGYSPHIKEALDMLPAMPRHVDVSFVGQTNHTRRTACVDAVRRYVQAAGGYTTFIHETHSFGGTHGPDGDDALDPVEYASMLLQSRIVVCPSGPATPDTFRLYEALEAGCVPIVDEQVADGTEWPGFFTHTFMSGVPFPVVKNWEQLEGVVPQVLADYDRIRLACRTWWQDWKRNTVYTLDATVRDLAGLPVDYERAADRITVCVTTSPAAMHPDTSHVEQVIDSVRERIPGVDVLIGCDGSTDDTKEYADRYADYLVRLQEVADERWPGTLLWIAPHHLHQGGVLRELLTKVHTPLILFVEHDTPLVGDIPFDQITELVQGDAFDHIRLHYGTEIGDYHLHMMLDTQPVIHNGVPIIRTYQWSQRPHVAQAGWYRWLLDAHEITDGFVEETMHSVCSVHWREFGYAGWSRFRLGIYAPSGNDGGNGMERSRHLDTRKALDHG